MKRIIFLIGVFIFAWFSSNSQTTHTINISGLSFSPDDITIATGDTIFFNGSSDHPVLQVSESTWNANDDEPLSGGFAFSSGTGKVSLDSVGTYYYICENHVGSGMKGKINVSATTNTQLFEFRDIRIYPNPLTTDLLSISLPNNNLNIKLHIYDLTGRLIISTFIPQANDHIRINSSELSAGAYIIQLRSGDSIYTSKLIKN